MRQRIEDRLQRQIQRLTILRAVRLVATVALSHALVAALLEWWIDPAMGSLRDALWFSIVTVTTVGYGDIVPETTGGRIVASVLMLAGVSAIPITTSIIVAIFVSRSQQQERKRDEEERQELLERLTRIEQALVERERA
jgi:voltage-gated potassium channel